MKNPSDSPRVLIWDLETTGLDAGFAFILCAAYQWLGEKKVHVISIGDPRYAGRKINDDRKVVKAMSDVLMSADLNVTYNGSRFDIPFLQTRRWIHGLPVLPRRPKIDLYFTARSLFRTRSKSLKSISQLDPTIPVQKSPVLGRHWVDAMSGDRRALTYIVRHCIADVKVLAHEYERMAQHVWQHPRLTNDTSACRFCGDPVQRRGYALTTQKNRPIRVQCTGCGRWDQRVESRRAA